MPRSAARPHSTGPAGPPIEESRMSGDPAPPPPNTPDPGAADTAGLAAARLGPGGTGGSRPGWGDADGPVGPAGAAAGAERPGRHAPVVVGRDVHGRPGAAHRRLRLGHRPRPHRLRRRGLVGRGAAAHGDRIGGRRRDDRARRHPAARPARQLRVLLAGAWTSSASTTWTRPRWTSRPSPTGPSAAWSMPWATRATPRS